MRCICFILICVLAVPGLLNASPSGLDSSLQLLKQQALELERDLLILEEQLDHPLVIYLSMDAAHKFKLESLHILLDGEPLQIHEYDSNTRDALRKGGAQLVYSGKLALGQHELIAYYRSNRDHQRGAKLEIHKTLKPTFIEIIIQSQQGTETRLRPELFMREWDNF